MDRSLEAIKVDPLRFAGLVAVRTVDYWFATLFSHSAPGKGGWPGGPFRSAGALFLMFETAILAWGILLIHGMKPELRWLLAVIVSFSLIYCVTHIEVRYRTPCEPAVAIVVAALVVGLWQSLARGLARQDSRG